MKKLKLLSIVLFAVIFSGCSDDDEDNSATLQGQWKLVQVTGGLAGVNHQFTGGVVVWNFNTTAETVSVNNTNTDETLQDFMNSGSYDYQFIENTITADCDEIIEIDGISFGCMALGNDALVFTQIEDDGFILTFTR